LFLCFPTEQPKISKADKMEMWNFRRRIQPHSISSGFRCQ